MSAEHLVAQPLGQGIDGIERRQRAALEIRLIGRPCHGVAILPCHADSPVKAEHRPDREGVAQVFLIEEGDLAGAAVVKGAELAKGHTPLDAADSRLGRHSQNRGHSGAVTEGIVARLAQAVDIAARLVGTGEMVEQVLRREHAYAAVSGLARAAHAGQGFDGCMQVHGDVLLSAVSLRGASPEGKDFPSLLTGAPVFAIIE